MWFTQVVAAESRSKDLQEELTATYKEKSRLAEELVGASRQLQIVRDSNEAQVSAPKHILQMKPLTEFKTLHCLASAVIWSPYSLISDWA